MATAVERWIKQGGGPLAVGTPLFPVGTHASGDKPVYTIVPADSAHVWVPTRDGKRATLRSWEIEAKPGLVLQIDVLHVEPQCTRISAKADLNGQVKPITVARLRNLPIEHLIQASVPLNSVHLVEHEGEPLGERHVTIDHLERFNDLLDGLVRSRGHPRVTDEEHLRTLEIAKDARERGESPVEAVQRELHLSPAGAKKRLYRARAWERDLIARRAGDDQAKADTIEPLPTGEGWGRQVGRREAQRERKADSREAP